MQVPYGAHGLVNVLIEIQQEHVRTCLPGIRQKIKAERATIQSRLEELTDLVDDPVSAWSKLGMLLGRLEASLRSISVGRFEDLVHEGSSMARAMEDPKFRENIQLMTKLEQAVRKARSGRTRTLLPKSVASADARALRALQTWRTRFPSLRASPSRSSGAGQRKWLRPTRGPHCAASPSTRS